jgi:hypothetical protein
VRLRVGVTGHRPGPKLPDAARPAIASSIKAIFDALAAGLDSALNGSHWAFSAKSAELMVVSALAEGADRMVAHTALDAGLPLEVVLPATRTVYERDFASEGSKAEFRALLASARSVFEVDRPAGPLGQKRGYEAAGLIMLGHADLLIAVWDEDEAAGIGGTANIVAQAVSEGAPVLLINPAEPTAIRLLWTGDMALPAGHVRIEDLPRREGLPLLPTVLQALIAPPADPRAREGLRAYYHDRGRRQRGFPFYSLFLWAFGVRPLRRTDFQQLPMDDGGALAWRERFPPRDPPDPLTDVVCHTLLPDVAISDRLAVRYSELYRSAFVFNFLAAAVAVSLALLGLLTELRWLPFTEQARLVLKAVLVMAEIALISAILAVWRVGARRGWHERWLNYRRAAEWLRHLRILTLVGARSPIARPRRLPGHRGGDHHASRLEQDDWVSWYVRSMERLLPLPNRIVDEAYLTEVRGAVIQAELNGQIAYHQANSTRMYTISHRLHRTGTFLFAAPVVVGASFLLSVVVELFTGLRLAEDIRFFVTGLTAAFPTFGAALNAIRVQGDFETVGQRSAGSAAQLTAVRAALEDEPLAFPRLADRTQRASEVMSLDLAEWQTLFRTRPLGLPA